MRFSPVTVPNSNVTFAAPVVGFMITLSPGLPPVMELMVLVPLAVQMLDILKLIADPVINSSVFDGQGSP